MGIDDYRSNGVVDRVPALAAEFAVVLDRLTKLKGIGVPDRPDVSGILCIKLLHHAQTTKGVPLRAARLTRLKDEQFLAGIAQRILHEGSGQLFTRGACQHGTRVRVRKRLTLRKPEPHRDWIPAYGAQREAVQNAGGGVFVVADRPRQRTAVADEGVGVGAESHERLPALFPAAALQNDFVDHMHAAGHARFTGAHPAAQARLAKVRPAARFWLVDAPQYLPVIENAEAAQYGPIPAAFRVVERDAV